MLLTIGRALVVSRSRHTLGSIYIYVFHLMPLSLLTSRNVISATLGMTMALLLKLFIAACMDAEAPLESKIYATTDLLDYCSSSLL